jgi:hypothetical protein
VSRLSIVSGGLLSALATLRTSWIPGVQIGLGAADITPDQTTSLAVIQPCIWSGYPGLLVLGAWGAPVLVGPRAQITGPQVIYTHNGGPISETVFTYYIVDAVGALLWVQRLPLGPVTMYAPAQQLRVTPVLTLRSEY